MINGRVKTLHPKVHGGVWAVAARTMPLSKNVKSSLSIWWLLTCIRSPDRRP
ncbi:hypothetical protein ACNKHU_25340 [Shigella flexneri]